jgi:hypothetical protein
MVSTILFEAPFNSAFSFRRVWQQAPHPLPFIAISILQA